MAQLRGTASKSQWRRCNSEGSRRERPEDTRAGGHEGLRMETRRSLGFLSRREQIRFPRDLEAGQGVQPWHGRKRRSKS